MFAKFISAFGPLFFLASGESVASHAHHSHLCASDQHSHKKGQHAGYVKPGAAVSLMHDYDGKTALGEFETVTVSLSHIYETGSLSVTLLTPPELQISAFTAIKNMPISDGSALDLPIQFSALQNGRFSLSLEVVYDSPDGHQSRRILSIPVNIGVAIKGKSRPSQINELVSARPAGVIAMPAREIIE